jgi:hypothetical protein
MPRRLWSDARLFVGFAQINASTQQQGFVVVVRVSPANKMVAARKLDVNCSIPAEDPQHKGQEAAYHIRVM